MTKPAWHDDLLAKFGRQDGCLAILGCGYVGLTLAVEFARRGFTVRGVEPDEHRAKELRAGMNPVPDVFIPDGELAELRDRDRLTFSQTLDQTCDAYLICVPTPLKDGSPDLRFIESAGEFAAAQLQSGQLVILESTTYPGTTEELLRPILEEPTKLVAGVDYALAYSPERINPGDRRWGLRNTTKVVGGLTPESTELACALYATVCDKLHPVSSPRAAEITKLFENTYREVNIALANEMAVVCHDFEIDPWEVLGAAASKEFGFTKFHPGPGTGGHCIPVDPQYLAWRVRGTFGRQFRMLETATEINNRMPFHVTQRAGEILNDHGKAIRGAEVLLLGVAYKGGSGDTRESPAIRVAGRLSTLGANIRYHDPFVPQTQINGFVYDSEPLTDETIRRADLVVVLADHPGIDYADVVSKAKCIYDTRGVTAGFQAPPGVLYRA